MSGPRDQHGGELPAVCCTRLLVCLFSFACGIARLRIEEANNQEMPTGLDIKSPNKNLFSLDKEPQKRQPSRTENL
jgi:hypothetical protein